MNLFIIFHQVTHRKWRSVSMETEPETIWLKTKEPQSIEDWKWMAQHVWRTKYDFSTPLKLKKKPKIKSRYKEYQRTLMGKTHLSSNTDLSKKDFKKKIHKKCITTRMWVWHWVVTGTLEQNLNSFVIDDGKKIIYTFYRSISWSRASFPPLPFSPIFLNICRSL